MGIRNEKKARREQINYTKSVVKNNAEIIKAEFDIEIPKDIMNMDNDRFHDFAEKLLTTITEEGWVAQEIGSVVSQLETCMRVYKHYHREVHYKGPTMFTK
ncbi:MAG: hypothetical protein IJX26_04000 [Clostridia bacterium]|nr:hypothetical protein [Clostridia bacterium]